MTISTIKPKDPISLHCKRSNTDIPGIVREVFDRQARVELTRKIGNRWLCENREVRLEDLSFRHESTGAVNLTDFQLC